MRRICVAMLLTALLGSVGATAGPIIYPLGQQSTVGFSNGSLAGATPRGWDFVINQPITVLELGVNAGVGREITMTLWNVTTETLLGQTSVRSQAFAWEFASLATPVALVPGDTFSVVGWADTTDDVPWYIYNNNPPPAFNPTGTVTYLNTRFANGIGPDQFPESTLGAPVQYGVADIGYTTVPEPGTLALIGAGLGLMGVIRRRRGGSCGPRS